MEKNNRTKKSGENFYGGKPTYGNKKSSQDSRTGKSCYSGQKSEGSSYGKSGYSGQKPGRSSYGNKPGYSGRKSDYTAKPANDREDAAGDAQNPLLREDLVIGRGAVLELLKTDREVECIYITSSQEARGSINALPPRAKQKGIPVKEVSPVKLDYMSGKQNHQGVIAVLAAARYSTIEDIFERAAGAPAFIVILDEITDPHNLGAIVRSAEAAGAHGIILPKRGGAGLTGVVSKTSAGAIEHIPVVRVPNLTATIAELKKRGVWLYAADMGGENWCSVDYSGSVAIVIGAEGKGVSRLVGENCDFTVSLPMFGKVGSLNASVAAGIVLYEVARQREKIPTLKIK